MACSPFHYQPNLNSCCILSPVFFWLPSVSPVEKVLLPSFRMLSSSWCSRPRGSHLSRYITYYLICCIIHSSLPTHSYLHRNMLACHISASFDSSSLGATFPLLFQSKQLLMSSFLHLPPTLGLCQITESWFFFFHIGYFSNLLNSTLWTL